MFSRRRRYRRSHTEGNTFVEAASQETASQDKETPDKFSLPPSRSPSPILNVARIAQATPESIASQEEEADSGQERETSIQEEEDIQEGPGDQEYPFKQEYLDDQGELGDQDRTRRSGAAPAENELAGALDPFTEGRKKLSEFWPIYLKEADNFDRELSEGWNKLSALISFYCCIDKLTIRIV
ncbi:hypothetical protein BDV93DRAFT_558443 [Ceratobasidium sp. AG-I]|nr:hypothetical protein BDV93DRAFT_558443 [Ceratobasidium sp. AG-I]